MADIIKEHRERLELTQQQLADMVDVSRQMVIRWESGDAVPGEKNLRRLSEVFHVTPSDLRYPNAPVVRKSPEPWKAVTPRRRLDPAVYERIDAYLKRMEQAGCAEWQVETAERLMTVWAWSTLHADDGQSKSVEKQLRDVDAAWNAVRESVGSDGGPHL